MEYSNKYEKKLREIIQREIRFYDNTFHAVLNLQSSQDKYRDLIELDTKKSLKKIVRVINELEEFERGIANLNYVHGKVSGLADFYLKVFGENKFSENLNDKVNEMSEFIEHATNTLVSQIGKDRRNLINLL